MPAVPTGNLKRRHHGVTQPSDSLRRSFMVTVGALCTGPTGSLERRVNCWAVGDEKAKNKAVFSYQFGYQLAH
jgi:hypothetical protein